MAELAIGVIGLLGSIQLVFDIVSRAQEATWAIVDFQNHVHRLKTHLAFIEEHEVVDGQRYISQEDRKDIKRILGECRKFFEKHERTITGRGKRLSLRRRPWCVVHGPKLQQFRVHFEGIFNHTITPAYHQISLHRLRPAGPCSRPASGSEQGGSAGGGGDDILLLESQDTFTPERGDPPDFLDENGLFTAQDGWKRNAAPSVPAADTLLARDAGADEAYVALETTLFIEKVSERKIPDRHRRLHFTELQIVVDPTGCIVLSLRQPSNEILVIHKLPSDASLYVADISDRSDRKLPTVMCLGSHPITVADRHGSHSYMAECPRYEFPDLKTRKRFQQLVRGQKLVGEFVSTGIFAGGTHEDCQVAQVQVLQLWIRREGTREALTMAFLADLVATGSSRGHGPQSRQYQEWHFEDYGPLEVEKVQSANPLKRSKAAMWRLPSLDSHDTNIKDGFVRFNDQSTADKFKAKVERYHRSMPPDEKASCPELCPSLSTASTLQSHFSSAGESANGWPW